MFYGKPLHEFTLNFRFRTLVLMILAVFLNDCGEAAGLKGFGLVVFTCFVGAGMLKIEKLWITRSRYKSQCAKYVGRKVMPVVLEDFIDDNYARFFVFIALSVLTALITGKFAYIVLYVLAVVFCYMTTRYEEHFWGELDAE